MGNTSNSSKGASYSLKKVLKGANHHPKKAPKGASYNEIHFTSIKKKHANKANRGWHV